MSFIAGTERQAKDDVRKKIATICKPYVDKWGADKTGYISLAGCQYIDSYLMHDSLGIPFANMASAERNKNSWRWAQFSKPTHSFELRESFYDICMDTHFRGKERIIWYDTCSTSETILNGEVQRIFSADMMRTGTLVFFTFIEAPRRANDDAIVKRDDELPTFSDDTDSAIYKRFCEKIADIAKEQYSSGVKVLLAVTYASSSNRVFVVGFETTETVGLVNDGIPLDSLSHHDTTGDGALLTQTELNRIALIFKVQDLSKLPPRGGFIAEIGIDRGAVSTTEIRELAQRMDTETEEAIRKNFPVQFSHLIQGEYEPEDEPEDEADEEPSDEETIDELRLAIRAKLEEMPKEQAVKEAVRVGVDLYKYALTEDPRPILSKISIWKKLFAEIKAARERLGDAIPLELETVMLLELDDDFMKSVRDFKDGLYVSIPKPRTPTDPETVGLIDTSGAIPPHGIGSGKTVERRLVAIFRSMNNQPLTVPELVKKMKNDPMYNPKTPCDNLRSMLYHDIKYNKDSIFVQVNKRPAQFRLKNTNTILTQ